jgi:pyrimidine-specific ribonucleoside hydrolase
MKQNFIFDMETSDPDDVFALALLATHPRSNLVAVTIHPGGKDQVGLVKHILNLLGKSNIPVGVGSPKSDKLRVSQFHYNWLGKIPDQDPDGTAVEVIHDAITAPYSMALTLGFEPRKFHLVTGAALTNIAAAYNSNNYLFDKWTCQGGFAGENIVPAEFVLEKFKGKNTCLTFNLGGDKKAAEFLICNPNPPIPYRRFVTKNVCHGIFHSPEVNEQIPSGAHAGLDFIKDGMNFYFKRNPGGKALHDVIAAAAAIEPEIATWKSAFLYRNNKNEWGCTENPGDESSKVIINLDISRFNKVLVS